MWFDQTVDLDEKAGHKKKKFGEEDKKNKQQKNIISLKPVHQIPTITCCGVCDVTSNSQ